MTNIQKLHRSFMDHLPDGLPEPIEIGDNVFAFDRSTGEYCVAKVAAYLPRSTQYRVKMWNFYRERFAAPIHVEPSDIMGKVPDLWVTSVAARLLALNQMRHSQVQAIDRVARQSASQIYEEFCPAPATGTDGASLP
jgi:hypothetical protein